MKEIMIEIKIEMEGEKVKARTIIRQKNDNVDLCFGFNVIRVI
jgi:hypothetical protein